MLSVPSVSGVADKIIASNQHLFSPGTFIQGNYASVTYPIDPSWPQSIASFENELLVITNNFRASKGAGPLSFTPTLAGSARWKVGHMAQYMYMQHDDLAPPIARTWYDRIVDNGYSGAAGENIAYGLQTAQDVFDAWTSVGPGEGHYDNIVYPFYTLCGFGCARGANGLLFWCQDFGMGTPPPPPPPPTKPKPAAGQIWLNANNVKLRITSVLNGRVTYTNTKTGLTGHYSVATFQSKFSYLSG